MKEASIVLTVIVPMIIFILILMPLLKKKEHWEVYKQKPYGHIKTGSEPMNYYVKKRYRKPYRYPFQIVKDHPVKHLSYLD